MKTSLKIISILLAIALFILITSLFIEGSIWTGIFVSIIGTVILLMLVHQLSPTTSLNKAIKSFPNIDSKLIASLLMKESSWVNNRSFKNTAIEGFDKVINYKNVQELGEKYLNFYVSFFPHEGEEIRSKINRKLVEAFAFSKMENETLNPNAINGIVEKSNELKVLEYNSTDKVQSHFELNILDWKLSKGIFPNLESDFILQKDEQCVYKYSRCEILERKQVTKRVNYAGPRARIKIANGLSYNVGSFRVSTNKETVNVSKGTGILNLTTKRILFKSEEKNITIILSSIIDIEPYSDAVIISKSTGNPLILNVKDGLRFYKLLDASIENLNSGQKSTSKKLVQSTIYKNESNDDKIMDVILTDGLLKAVKYYKETNNVSLKEAKDYVDNLYNKK